MSQKIKKGQTDFRNRFLILMRKNVFTCMWRPKNSLIIYALDQTKRPITREIKIFSLTEGSECRGYQITISWDRAVIRIGLLKGFIVMVTLRDMVTTVTF